MASSCSAGFSYAVNYSKDFSRGAEFVSLLLLYEKWFPG